MAHMSKVRLGGYGLPVGSDDPVAFARAHRDFGYSAAYVPATLTADDSAALAAFAKAFADADVLLAEIGIWRSLVPRDAAQRKANLAYAADKLAVADALGAGCAVTYIGSLDETAHARPVAANFTDEAFDAAVETARYLIDLVKPTRTKFALEMMQNSLPDSIESYVRLIKAIDRPAFAAHLDPVNIIMTPRSYWDNAALIRACFDALGDHIVSCHAKDIRLSDDAAVHLDEVQIGEGVLDYGTYLTQLARLSRDVPLMLEHLPDDAYPLARDRVFAAGDAAGVGFVHRD